MDFAPCHNTSVVDDERGFILANLYELRVVMLMLFLPLAGFLRRFPL